MSRVPASSRFASRTLASLTSCDAGLPVAVLTACVRCPGVTPMRSAYAATDHSGARLRSRAFDFHIEALAHVFRAGLPIAEVPITYRYTNSSLRAPIVWEALRTWGRLWSRELT